MKETRQNVLVGLFVLVGLGILGVLAVLFGSGYSGFLGGTGYEMKILFASAEGIREGNEVTVGGIRVGRVTHVDFVDRSNFARGVSVSVRIDEQFQVPADSRAVTTEPGLGQGRPPIEIIPGSSSTLITPGMTIPGEVQGTIESIVPRTIVSTFETTAQRLGDAAAALTPVLDDVHEILTQRRPSDVDRPGGPQGNLSSAITRFDQFLKNMNDLVGDGDTISQIKDSIANIKETTENAKVASADIKDAAGSFRTIGEDGKRLVSKAEALVDDTHREINGLAVAFRDVTDRASTLLDTFYRIAAVIDAGDGTIGHLVHDNKLYEAMVLTAERLADAVDEFRVLIKDWQKGTIRVAF